MSPVWIGLLILFVIGIIVGIVFFIKNKSKCGYDEKLCGDTCYNVGQNSCAENKKICPQGQTNLCGDTCYNPNNSECVENKKICPKNQTNLCDNECYNPSISACAILVDEKGVADLTKHVICPLESFNPNNKLCCKYPLVYDRNLGCVLR